MRRCVEGVFSFEEEVDVPGEVAERPKAHAWKACIRQRIVGSNPTLSAKCFCARSPQDGELAEWLKAPDSKSGDGKPFGGSNPSLSANQIRTRRRWSPGT